MFLIVLLVMISSLTAAQTYYVSLDQELLQLEKFNQASDYSENTPPPQPMLLLRQP
ncbi:hypothetical protein [Candidatus Synchoanobacter obligatus]|uniref:Uncharacterized protein n=1 Tax=Candidatus Synchoanobacter obligatus TaxID=2919597 RepID=A0ABT1L652_9GAMM|nr:hypothetical protein [Candidatus Synchoanobacter obligatus]MCP8352647.1 hypothetical protein [Candidatus Synchoanobacter obligatus]